MNNTLERIENLINRRGITAYTLCKSIGIANSTYNTWKQKDRVPKSDKLQLIADYFNVSVDYLLTGEEKKQEPTGQSIRIPVLGSIPAGIPLEAIEDIVDWEEIPHEWTAGGKEYFSLRVKGDSMSPEYLDGDNLILRKTPDCESGDDCAVFVNGYDATFKRVIKNIDHVILQPINPNYRPTMYDYGSGDNIRIAGVVVELRRTKRR